MKVKSIKSFPGSDWIAANGQPPTPDSTDGRICFGIDYFLNEADANKYADYIKARGDTYNGGWYHGKPCGRDKTFDYTNEEGQRLYAVTTA